jgi:hypothetical protein
MIRGELQVAKSRRRRSPDADFDEDYPQRHGIAGEPWGTGPMIALIIGTLLIPLIGIVFGIMGLCSSEKKGQGGTLLALGMIMLVVYLAAFAA